MLETVILENINNTKKGLFNLNNTSISLIDLKFTNITSNVGGIIYGD